MGDRLNPSHKDLAAKKLMDPSCHMSVLESLPKLSHSFIERITTVQEGYHRPFSYPESLNL